MFASASMQHFTLTLMTTEMPTSRDLKSGDCLLFHNPPPEEIDPAPKGSDLGHYMTSYMMNILSKFEIIV